MEVANSAIPLGQKWGVNGMLKTGTQNIANFISLTFLLLFMTAGCTFSPSPFEAAKERSLADQSLEIMSISPDAPFSLIDASTDQVITDLYNGIQVKPGNDLSFRANVQDGVKSVVLELEGPVQHSRTENVAPYALFSDNRGDYRGRDIPEGTYSLSGLAYSEKNGKGTLLDKVTIEILVTSEPTNPDPDPVAATLNLIDANTGEAILLVTEGGRFEAPDSANIQAEYSDSSIDSVQFQLSGPVNHSQTENYAPYALFGDSSGNYYGKSLPDGSYSLTIKGFSGTSLMSEETVSFEVISSTDSGDSGGSTDPAPGGDLSQTPIYQGCTAPSLSSNTWYVDPINGSSNGDGSASNPWRTLQEVFANGLIESRKPAEYPYDGSGSLVTRNPGAPIKAGDTIVLRSGHHGSVTDKSYYNDDFIQIIADEGHTPVLGQFSLVGSSKWIINGLTFKGGANPLLSVASHSYAGPSSEIIYLNNSLYSKLDVSTWSADDWINNQAFMAIVANAPCSSIYKNTIRNVGFGIVAGGQRSIIQENLIDGFSKDGIRTLASYQTIRKNSILNSYKVDANHDDAIQSWVPSGETSLTDQVIEGNLIIESTDPHRPLQESTDISQPLQGIGFFDGFFDNTVIRNNVIVVGSWHAISIYGARKAQIINNTAVNMHPDRYSWILIHNHKDGRVSDGVIRNNISNRVRSSDTASVVMDHNIEIPQGSSEHFVLWDEANQKFDLHLTSTSTAINAGSSSLAPTYDFDGVLRDSAVDIGAYEYTGTSDDSSGGSDGSGGTDGSDGSTDPSDPINADVVVYTSSELNSALDAAKGGEVILLKDGDYGSFTVRGKSFTSPVHIIAENAQGAHFGGLTVDNVSNLIVEGIDVTMTADQNYGISLLNSSHITVLASHIYAADFNGGKNLFMKNTKNTLFQGNTISSTNDGVHTVGSIQNATFDLNTIKIRPDKVSDGAHADVFQFRSSPLIGIKISRNVLAYAHQNIFQQNSGDGPWKDIEISGNVSLLKSKDGTAFAGKHISFGDIENIRIEGNTFAAVKAGEYGHGVYLSGVVTGESVVKNNIFYNAVYTTPTQVSDHNLFYADVKKIISGYSSLSDYQAATGNDLNSIEANPLFMDLTGADLRLQSSSPAINQGASLSIDPVDLYGTARPQDGLWDIGAVEY